MDKAGRVIVPASLRSRLGLMPGPIGISTDGASVIIELIPHDGLVDDDGLLMIGGDGPEITTEDIRELRLVDRR